MNILETFGGRLPAHLNRAIRRMLSSPPPDEAPEAARLRGALFTDLDRLAFAIEMEAATLAEEGREEDAARQQLIRLGVRLAQRLVSGVPAPEVEGRLDRHAAAYEARLGLTSR